MAPHYAPARRKSGHPAGTWCSARMDACTGFPPFPRQPGAVYLPPPHSTPAYLQSVATGWSVPGNLPRVSSTAQGCRWTGDQNEHCDDGKQESAMAGRSGGIGRRIDDGWRLAGTRRALRAVRHQGAGRGRFAGASRRHRRRPEFLTARRCLAGALAIDSGIAESDTRRGNGLAFARSGLNRRQCACCTNSLPRSPFRASALMRAGAATSGPLPSGGAKSKGSPR